MKRLFKLLLASALMATSLYGQEVCETDEMIGSAYMESSHTAHWSVYIPLALIAGAAILFGVADGHHEKHHSDSQDGLGSLDSSKRHSSHRSSCSCSSICRHSRSSHSSFCHH